MFLVVKLVFVYVGACINLVHGFIILFYCSCYLLKHPCETRIFGNNGMLFICCCLLLLLLVLFKVTVLPTCAKIDKMFPRNEISMGGHFIDFREIVNRILLFIYS